MHTRSRTALATAALVVAPILAVVLPAAPVAAHGTLSSPASRVYTCRFKENPENPTSAACRAAVAAGGTQPFYDWNEVSRLDAGGRSREIIPDGQLCGAGRDKYRGLNLARSDWPATQISPGNLTVTYHATAPHANSNFEFLITRPGYNPNTPLKWSDLVSIRTFNNQNPTTFTNWTIPIPQRTGRHVLFSLWQRVVGSQEAFYTCSDVTFGAAAAASSRQTSPSEVTSPARPVPARPAPAVGTWTANGAYHVGDQATYQGQAYRCQVAHTSIPGWEPDHAQALWTRI